MAIYLTEAVLGLEIAIGRTGRHVPAIDASLAMPRGLAAQPAAAQTQTPARRAG
jgi:hypothetical protein